jgi:DNA-binding CsgD family transcriptional regulator
MKSLDDLTRLIYDAALCPHDYPAVAAEINDAIRCDGASLILHRRDEGAEVIAATMVNYDHLPVDDILDQYAGEWHRANPQLMFERANPAAPLFFEGGDPRFDRERFPDFAAWRQARLGIRSQMTGYCRPDDEHVYAFAFSSHRHEAPESDRQIALLARIMGHVRASVRLAFQTGGLSVRRPDLLEQLEQVAGSSAVLGQGGRPLFASTAFERIVRDNDLLRLSGAGLSFTPPHLQKQWLSLLNAAMDDASGAGVMLIPAQDGHDAMVLEVAPLSAAAADRGSGGGRALVTIRPWQAPEAHRLARYRGILGLTPAEAKAAVLLARGLPDEEIAEALGCRTSTVRTHVKAILDKAQVRSKAELAHLLTGLGR